MLPSHIASKHPLRQPENIHVSEKNVYFDWNWPNPSSPYYLYLYHLSVILHIHSAKVTAVGQLLCGQPWVGRRSLRMLHCGFDLVKCTLYDMWLINVMVGHCSIPFVSWDFGVMANFFCFLGLTGQGISILVHLPGKCYFMTTRKYMKMHFFLCSKLFFRCLNFVNCSWLWTSFAYQSVNWDLKPQFINVPIIFWTLCSSPIKILI